ncbi:AtzE family amidohydrolase [Caulobacter hibisci]|uniref:AtzE family amidohydrolase n=1 Tax=Caulobacter hibisci TaxID=2035993 RepID=A0ABS0T4V1_9CAUL|nr:AtzE family amidohydrolase [Caulobacter hibisci]
MSFATAQVLTTALREGRTSARETTQTAIAAAKAEPFNAFTAVFEDEALAQADAVDARLAVGENPGPLAGVPFAVKNLFDVAGHVTLAGSKIRREAAPATADATAVARMKAAGAVLVGALNMDEFAYGFVTENAHDGPTRNPHDPARIAGGSSGGSAAAVAGGLLPLTLGSDTNGSIRIPAGLCGVFGLKPTLGRLSRVGAFPFVHSLDHIGPFARTAADLALAYDVLQGEDPLDDLAPPPADPLSGRLDALADQPLRVGCLSGWFQQGAFPEVVEALEIVADALQARRGLTLPGAQAARAAAFAMSASEGGRLHFDDLAQRALDYDPAVRDRLLAGALLPDGVAEAARRYRPAFRDEARGLFEHFDILLAPVTPCPAPPIGQATMELDGLPVSVRKTLGAYTQPISYVGLPVIAAPVNRPGKPPIGVQLIAPAWREDLAFAAALRLERAGVIAAHRPPLRREPA